MKNKIILFSILLIIFSCKKEILQALSESQTTDFLIDSNEKAKTYRIWVYLPVGYEQNVEKYQTIYVLDPDDKAENGPTNFLYIAKLCQKLSEQNKKPSPIVIGIRHGDYREIDYTPTKFTTKGFSGEGGADQFLKFIKKELIPKIEKDYRVMPNREKRAIIGHSLGGLCGAYAFAKHNEAFGNYLLLSPSLIYDNEIILQYEQETRKSIQSKKQLVYFGVGGTEPNMVPPIDLLNDRLKKYYPNAKSKLYINSGKGHNSSKDENIKKALEFYFESI
jgi:predicted alpha/beta superfamily hydrolase